MNSHWGKVTTNLSNAKSRGSLIQLYSTSLQHLVLGPNSITLLFSPGQLQHNLQLSVPSYYFLASSTSSFSMAHYLNICIFAFFFFLFHFLPHVPTCVKRITLWLQVQSLCWSQMHASSSVHPPELQAHVDNFHIGMSTPNAKNGLPRSLFLLLDVLS